MSAIIHNETNKSKHDSAHQVLKICNVCSHGRADSHISRTHEHNASFHVSEILFNNIKVKMTSAHTGTSSSSQVHYLAIKYDVDRREYFRNAKSSTSKYTTSSSALERWEFSGFGLHIHPYTLTCAAVPLFIQNWAEDQVLCTAELNDDVIRHTHTHTPPCVLVYVFAFVGVQRLNTWNHP